MGRFFVLPLVLLAATFVLSSASCSTSAPATPPDAGPTEEGGVTDPFCKGRPLLPFCEDFDERALPGAFAEQVGGAPVDIRIVEEATAPSPPKALRLDKPAAAAGPVWLRTPRAPRTSKANAFFRVRIDRFGDDVEVAAFAEEGGHRVAMVVTKDGTVGVREPASLLDAGATALRLSPAKIELGTWASVRWDIRLVGGAGRTRLRVGAVTAFDAEPLALSGDTAAPRLEIGLETTTPGSTSAVTVSFDSITFEPTAE